MRIIRLVAAVGAALGLVAAVLAGSSAGVAGAVTATGTATSGPVSPTTAGAHSWVVTMATASSTTTTGTLAWNNTTFGLAMAIKTGQLASGTCVTVYFDWKAKGHHDARALRDCRSSDSYSFSFTDDNTKNLGAGPSRMGICYGTDDTIGTCTYYIASSGAVATSSTMTTPPVQLDWTPWPQPKWAYPCVLSWSKRLADGTVTTFVDAHSRKRLLMGSTC